MAMTSTQQARLAGGASLPATAGRAGFGGALRSEFTKIRSVRSTYWTLLALVLACIGIGVLFSLGEASHVQSFAGDQGRAPHVVANARSIAVPLSLFGLLVGQLVIAVLGALTITSEYSTGMIRTSLTTMPRRGTVFAAKAIVFGAVALVTGLITSFGSFFAGQAILATQNVGASIGQPRRAARGDRRRAVPHRVRAAVTRHRRDTPAHGRRDHRRHRPAFRAVRAERLPAGPTRAAHVDKWIPFNAGGAIWEQSSGQNMFGPWTGFAVFCGYAAVAMIGGLVLFRQRDA